MAKRAEDQIKQEVERLSKEIEVLERRARDRGLAFSSLDPKQLEQKARGETSKSPYIYAQGWSSGGPVGLAATYNVYVQNPDPSGYSPLYATIFFGLGNFTPIGEAWSGRDTRWPYVSSDSTYLASGASTNFAFSYTVPNVPLGTYNGNVVIWQGDYHDVGKSFDRGSFDFRVQ